MLQRVTSVLQTLKKGQTVSSETRQIVDISSIDVKYPVKIVGTRKPAKRYFWAWDCHITPLLIRECLNPYFYLTFQDAEGKLIGPIRYHSELKGWGFKLEVTMRSQFGRVSGLEEIELSSIPKKLEVQGFDTTFPTGGFVAIHYSKFKFKDPQLSNFMLQYFGVSTLGGLGHTRISNGLFEAEETTTDEGLPPSQERYAAFLVAASFIAAFGVALTIPVLVLMESGVLG